MLKKNLKYFKKACPQLYKLFKKYKPYHPNPVHSITEDIAYKQASNWLNNPVRIVYDIGHKETTSSIHLEVINDLFSRRKNDKKLALNEVKENGLVDMLVMSGLGNGWHIPYLQKQVKINTLIVYEPNPDIFWYSLHNIDWKDVLSKSNVIMSIGESPDCLINKVEVFLRKEGRFHVARSYIYHHYNNQYTNEAVRLFKDYYFRLLSGWGFFEDEIQGIQHSRVKR